MERSEVKAAAEPNLKTRTICSAASDKVKPFRRISSFSLFPSRDKSFQKPCTWGAQIEMRKSNVHLPEKRSKIQKLTYSNFSNCRCSFSWQQSCCVNCWWLRCNQLSFLSKVRQTLSDAHMKLLSRRDLYNSAIGISRQCFWVTENPKRTEGEWENLVNYLRSLNAQPLEWIRIL